MVKPDRPQLGASGLTNWAQFLHDAVVDALLTDDGDLQPGVALPEGGDPGNVVLLDSTLTAVWGTAQGEKGEPGLVWRSDWLSTEAYAFRDAVRHNGAVWYATVDIPAGDEPGVAAEWELLVDQGEVGPQGDQVELRTNATHIQWRYVGDPDWIDLIALDELEGPQGPAWDGWEGAWSSGATYALNDVVTFLAVGEDNAAAYVSLQDANTGNEPPAPGDAPDAWWDLVVRGGQDGEGSAGTATPTTVAAPSQAGAVGSSDAFSRQDHEHPSDAFVDKTGDTMTGALTLPGDAVADLEAVPKQQLDATVDNATTFLATGDFPTVHAGDLITIPAASFHVIFDLAGEVELLPGATVVGRRVSARIFVDGEEVLINGTESSRGQDQAGDEFSVATLPGARSVTSMRLELRNIVGTDAVCGWRAHTR